MKLLTAIASAVLASVLFVPAAGAATYKVTILNLTKGQPLSPPVIATHSSRDQVFGLHDYARYGVQQVAENGAVPTLFSELEEEKDLGFFDDVQRSMAGPLVPAGLPASADNPRWVTLTITAENANRLSWVSMLACTNDGFAGVNGIRLPRHIGQYNFELANAYDAGSETNTESWRDLVGACQAAVGVKSALGTMGTNMSNPSLRENRRIRHHRGILGVASDGLVPSAHNWYGPAGAIWVQRIA